MAAARLRQLVDEFRMLTSAFPDLRDAFDPDELPIDFILRRDAPSEPATPPTAHHRAGKQPASDD
jgi:hypothetical protein